MAKGYVHGSNRSQTHFKKQEKKKKESYGKVHRDERKRKFNSYSDNEVYN